MPVRAALIFEWFDQAKSRLQ